LCILPLGRCKHIHLLLLASELKVELDVKCQNDVTEFVGFRVIAKLSKTFLVYLSIL